MSTSSTQTTNIPEMTEQERLLLGLIEDTLLPAYLDEAGYDVERTPAVPWEESETYKDLNSRLEHIRDQYNAGELGWRDFQVQQERLYEDMEKAKADYVPTQGWDVSRRPSDTEIAGEMREKLSEVEEQYGRDSDEYRAAMDEYSADDQRAFQRDEIERLYLEKVQKYMEGDLSVTDDQRQFIEDQFKPVKAAVDELYSDSIEEVRERYKNFVDQVKETKMNVTDALNVVGEQIEQTGANMEKALTSTIETNRQLMKMGIEDATGQITKNISMAAIATGRDPSDPEYVNEIQQNISREVQRGSLQLTGMESQGRMGIAERTGAGLEDVARARARLEEATGQRIEGAIMAQGQEEQALIQQRGGYNIGIEEGKANLTQNLAMGLPPSQIGVGQGYQQFQEALLAQRLANATGSMQAAGYPYSIYAAERFAQPTTTTRQPWGPMDYLGIPLGIGTAGASIYSGVTTANAMDTMANRGGYTGYAPNTF